MTDQRPIDPSTLRDGDYVRAEGDGWAAEGYYYRREIRSKAGWNVVRLCGEPDERVTILRPVLVKGDRVELVGASRKRKASTATVCQVNGDYVAVIRDDDVADEWPIEAVRRLPTAPEPDPVCPFPMGARVVQPGGEEANVIGWEYCAECGRWEVQVDIGSGSDRWAAGALTLAPEPAPIEVGDWWADEGGWPCVVVKIGPTGNPFLLRWTSEHPDKAPSPETLRAAWTRLDGPPEPPVGSVYVIAGTVWHHHNVGHLPALMGIEEPRTWAEVVANHSSTLATLRILGSVD